MQNVLPLCFVVVVVVVVVVAGGSDYVDIGVTRVTLSQNAVTISFPLIDDAVFEITEVLTASLSLVLADHGRVSISFGFTDISILDDDGKLEYLAKLWHSNS